MAIRTVDSLVTLRTIYQRDKRFVWTLVAFVETPGCSNASTALLLFSETWQKLPTLTACRLLVASAQSALGGDRLVLRNLVAMLAGIDYIVSMVLDLLAVLCVVVGVTGT